MRQHPQAGSPFAALLAGNDDEANLILHRGAHCFVILNNSPYNPGHLMVLPNREVGELAELTAAERADAAADPAPDPAEVPPAPRRARPTPPQPMRRAAARRPASPGSGGRAAG